jgi:sarcosine oxidase subunit beta
VIGSEGHKLSLKQGAEGTVIIGGAYEGRLDAVSRRTALEPSKVAANLANAVRLFPHLRSARIVRTWAGVEGMTADALPVLGPSGTVPGLVHAFGFSGHGFALAPLVGRLVADLVRGRASDLPLAPFAIERFDAARVAAE